MTEITEKYLTLRGANNDIYFFQKRVSEKVADIIGTSFVKISLRTKNLSEAISTRDDLLDALNELENCDTLEISDNSRRTMDSLGISLLNENEHKNSQTTNEPDQGRRKVLIGLTAGVAAAGVAFAATPFVTTWNPSARAKAIGSAVKVDVSKLLPGEMMTVEWRGRPVFVVNIPEENTNFITKNLERLADPDMDDPSQPEYAKNEIRSRKKGIAVLTGVCTHLGCAPKYYPEAKPEDFDSNWQGGFFCPCHGSKFDLVGRVYANVPAPTNLVVPPHFFEKDNLLVIGSDGVS